MTNQTNRRLLAGASLAMFAQAASLNPMLRGPMVAYAPNGNEGGDTATLLKDVKSELERIGGDVKRTAEDALKQAKESGQVTAEVKAKADELLVAQTTLKGQLEALETRQLELEQRGAGRREEAEPVRSFGHQVANSAELKAFVDGGARGSLKVPVRQAITSLGTSAGALITADRETEIVGMPRRRLRIRQLLNQGRTTSNMVEYARQSVRTNNAGVVAEGAQKPESNYVWEKKDAPVRTIAHWVPITRQALEDAAQLETEIDTELRYGLDRAEEDEILNGDGTGEHLTGLQTLATPFVAAFNPDMPNTIDRLRLAVLQLELADFDFDGAVLHPTDWAGIELTKDEMGRYILANPLQLAGPVLWGRPVVSTAAQDLNQFLVGAFQMAATIYDRMDAEVLLSTEDRDNFVKNMVTARAEKRLALAVKRPAALIKGDFTIAP